MYIGLRRALAPSRQGVPLPLLSAITAAQPPDPIRGDHTESYRPVTSAPTHYYNPCSHVQAGADCFWGGLRQWYMVRTKGRDPLILDSRHVYT